MSGKGGREGRGGTGEERRDSGKNCRSESLQRSWDHWGPAGAQGASQAKEIPVGKGVGWGVTPSTAHWPLIWAEFLKA